MHVGGMITTTLKPGYLREKIFDGKYFVCRYRPALRWPTGHVMWQGEELHVYPSGAIAAAKRKLERARSI